MGSRGIGISAEERAGSRVCDDIELASLTGLTPDHIRKATRRIRRPA
ncbi:MULTISPECIES: hypothetical protein [Arthrobacter]|nr:hypothetical protein [Arthrobacter ramosus]